MTDTTSAPCGVLLTDFELTSTDGQEPTSDAVWLPVSVPEGVHEALLAQGSIEHPYRGSAELELSEIEAATWWYRTRFAGEQGQRTTLRFGCLDTVAEIHLNGEHVLSARNQHRPHEVEVVLKEDNELVLCFPPPLEAVRAEVDVQGDVAALVEWQRVIRPDDPPMPEAEVMLRATRPRLRKATFSWGWDFAPVVPSRGVLGDVTLTPAAAVVDDVQVRTRDLDVTTRRCVLEVTGTVSGADTVVVEVDDPSGTRIATQTWTGGAALHVALLLSDVQLWWTHDLGDPALHTVRLTARNGEQVVEQLSLQYGIRSLELDRSADPTEDARLFRFVLNGVPTFSRGACWVPPSMLVGSTPEESVRGLVRLSRDGGMTMIRVWGGGVYPSDAFFDACDELGVLVWQDFMFACFDYPDPNGALAAEVALEAEHQVRRLRHHASLALWCGENEVQGIHEIVHGQLMPRGRGWELFHEVLPDVLERLDPDRPYWPGSPWAEREDEILNGTQDGDRHAWEVWHGGSSGAGGPTEFASRAEERHFHRYDHDTGRFISEFGIHASPELATLRRWAGEDLTEVGSPALLHRIKDTPQDKGFVLMQFETGEPTTLEEYVDFSMAVQAEGLKHGVEHYRRRQPHCSGTLVWQLNDSWPGTSWSVIDYDLTPKASYYFLQRAYQPLLASFALDDDGLALWVSNSGQAAADVDLTVMLMALDGGGGHTESVRVVAEPYSSQPVWRSPGRPGRQTVATVREGQDRLPANRRFFAPLKDLPLSEGSVTASVIDKGAERATVELQADGYCYLARLSSDLPGARFSTNYLDLLDGERRVVDVTDLPSGAGLSVASYGRPGHQIL